MPPLNRLAIHVLSICPNSANCERLFSILGFIMSDYRTRLTISNLMNIAELRMHLRDKWSRKETKARLKQHLGEKPKDDLRPSASGQSGACQTDLLVVLLLNCTRIS